MYMVSVMYMVVVQYSSIKEPKAGKIMNASVEYPIQQGRYFKPKYFLTIWKMFDFLEKKSQTSRQ